MKEKGMPVVAMVYDFDGTLAPGNMQEFGLLKALGYDNPGDFWDLCDNIAKANDAGSIAVVMYALQAEAKRAGIPLTRERLQAFGQEVSFFPGVLEWFDKINAYAAEIGVEVKHYINSSGVKEMVEGCDIAKHFEKIYACTYLYDNQGEACWPAVVVDYTKKTQFLFKISKGVSEVSDKVRVNEYMPEEERPVPLDRMIYFGDGETDVPCMRTVKAEDGYSFAVYGNEKKRAVAQQLLDEGRVNFACEADYSEKGEIMKRVRQILDKIKADFALEID
jgi:phosphoserine phosphatase